MRTFRGFIKGQLLGKLTACEHNFTQLLLTSQPMFLTKEHISNLTILSPGAITSSPIVQILNETPDIMEELIYCQ